MKGRIQKFCISFLLSSVCNSSSMAWGTAAYRFPGISPQQMAFESALLGPSQPTCEGIKDGEYSASPFPFININAQVQHTPMGELALRIRRSHMLVNSQIQKVVDPMSGLLVSCIAFCFQKGIYLHVYETGKNLRLQATAQGFDLYTDPATEATLNFSADPN